MNKIQKELVKKLIKIGIPKKSAKRYASGGWSLPKSIKEIVENEDKK